MSTLNEKLDLIIQARDDIQSALADKGQVVGKDIRDYAEAVTNITTSEDLTDVLDAQDQRIAELETALDNKTASGGGEPNIFVQDNEPTKKDGIWLQIDKEMEHYVFDDNIFIGGTWALASETANLPASFSYRPVVSVGKDIYIFNDNNGGKSYKYNTLTNTYIELTQIPFAFWSGCAATIGTDIYLFGGGGATQKAYKYDTLTDTYTRLADIPYAYRYGCAASVGINVYIFSTDMNSSDYYKAYKYDTLTDTYTQITDLPYNCSDGDAISIGTSIYIFGGKSPTTLYKYDTLTDTYIQLTNIPYSYKGGGIATVGNDIYLFGGANNSTACYKYDTLTDTYTQLTNIPYSFSNGNATSVNTSIYLLGGANSLTTNRRFNTTSKSYETDNTVVVAQGRTYDIGYNTKLINTNAEGDYQPLYGFADAYFYTTQNGLDGTMPVYYGDGTNWINIKNPPPLPSQYTELEYIESTGTQYIETNFTTDVVNNNSAKIESEVKWNSIQEKQYFGANYGNFVGINNGVYNCQGFVTNIVPTTSDFQEISSTITYSNRNVTGYIDNNTFTGSRSSSIESSKLCIFAIIDPNNLATSLCNCKMKYFKFYYNNVLAYNFVPVKRASDNEIGMYETVTNQFFTNQGTGSFIAGPEKEVEE